MLPAEAEAADTANRGCAADDAGEREAASTASGARIDRCRRQAHRPLPAERASTAAGGSRGGCIAAWEVDHVEDEHEGSVENFGG